jgi:antirestriction protein ArdC
MKPIKDDVKFIVQAAAQAQKATDLILGVTFEENVPTPVETPELVAA